MKAISTAYEMFRTDTGQWLIDFWDDDIAAGQQRLRDWGTKQAQNARGGNFRGIRPPDNAGCLSAQHSDRSLPDCPPDAKDFGGLVEENDWPPPWTFMYIDDPAGTLRG